MHGNRKQISYCLGIGWGGGRAAGKQEGEMVTGQKETFEDNGYVPFLGCGDGFMVYTYVKFIKMYIFIMCQSLYVNYTST